MKKKKTSELEHKLLVGYTFRMILVVIAIIATLVAAPYRCIKKMLFVNMLLNAGCYVNLEVIPYFLYTYLHSMHFYRYPFDFDQWKSVFFASYGLVFYTDNDYKKAVLRNDQEDDELMNCFCGMVDRRKDHRQPKANLSIF